MDLETEKQLQDIDRRLKRLEELTASLAGNQAEPKYTYRAVPRGEGFGYKIERVNNGSLVATGFTREDLIWLTRPGGYFAETDTSALYE